MSLIPLKKIIKIHAKNGKLKRLAATAVTSAKHPDVLSARFIARASPHTLRRTRYKSLTPIPS